MAFKLVDADLTVYSADVEVLLATHSYRVQIGMVLAGAIPAKYN